MGILSLTRFWLQPRNKQKNTVDFMGSPKRTWELFRIHKKLLSFCSFLTLNLVYSWWYQYHRSTDLRFSQRMAHAWAYLSHHLLNKNKVEIYTTLLLLNVSSSSLSPIRSLWILASKFPNQNHERWFMKPGHSSVQYRTRKTSPLINGKHGTAFKTSKRELLGSWLLSRRS